MPNTKINKDTNSLDVGLESTTVSHSNKKLARSHTLHACLMPYTTTINQVSGQRIYMYDHHDYNDFLVGKDTS